MSAKKENIKKQKETAAENADTANAAENNTTDNNTTGETNAVNEGVSEEMQALINENEAIMKECEELRIKADKEHELLLRVTAEYDNYRRRTSEEKNKIYADATADAVEKFLTVLDNIDRALEVPHEDDNPIYVGITMISKQFRETLDALGVTEIQTDIPFDPNLHNAVMHIEDETRGEGEIVEVFAKGYRLGDKILRHSVVKVAN